MKIRILVSNLVVLVVAGLFWNGTLVRAYGDIGNMVFKDTKNFAPVVFSHANHKSAGLGCADCHDVMFKKQRGSNDRRNAITMKTLQAGEFCGSCHNGQQAFSVNKNCKKCHNGK